MSYEETKVGSLVTIKLTCEARCGKSVCGSIASISTQSREAVQAFLYNLGWRLLRGHQVCGSCMRRKRISFPRKAKP